MALYCLTGRRPPLQLIFAFGVEQPVSPFIIGLLHQNLRQAVEIAVVRGDGIDPLLAGGDAVLFEHGQQQLGVDLRPCVKKLHRAALARVARNFSRNGCLIVNNGLVLSVAA